MERGCKFSLGSLKNHRKILRIRNGFQVSAHCAKAPFPGEYHSKQSCERQAAQPQGCFPPKESPAHQHKVVSAFISTQIGNNCVTIKTGG